MTVAVSSEMLNRWIDLLKHHDQEMITIDDRDLLSALEELKRLRELFALESEVGFSGVEL